MKRRDALVYGAVAGSLHWVPGELAAQAHGGIRTEEYSRVYHWPLDRLTEVHSVRVGMSKSDLLQAFMPDGGLQRFVPGRYVLRSCDLIEVDVEFRFPEGRSLQNPPPDSELTISVISKPYLERMNMD
jgi:hypothetical protein